MKDVCLKPDSGDAAAKGRLDFLSAVVYVCLLSCPRPSMETDTLVPHRLGAVVWSRRWDSLTLAFMADILSWLVLYRTCAVSRTKLDGFCLGAWLDHSSSCMASFLFFSFSPESSCYFRTPARIRRWAGW